MALRWVPLLLGAITFTSGTAGAQDIVPRIEVGPQVTQLYVPARTVGSVTYQPAVGAICSVKIKGNLVGFDSSFSFTPKTPNESTAFAGGRLTQAFFGIRVGISKGRLHLYAKVRPGFASFGNVILQVTPPPAFSFQLGRLTEPALDAGGIVMITISRRFAVRYDVGDTLIFYEAMCYFQDNHRFRPGRLTIYSLRAAFSSVSRWEKCARGFCSLCFRYCFRVTLFGTVGALPVNMDLSRSHRCSASERGGILACPGGGRHRDSGQAEEVTMRVFLKSKLLGASYSCRCLLLRGEAHGH